MVPANKFLLAALLLIAAVGCSKLPLQQTHKYEPKPLDRNQGVDCWTYVETTPRLATMKAAVELCGMQSYYQETAKKYTWLLLDETAFSTYILPRLGVEVIADAPVEALKDILLFHIIKGEYDSYNGAVGYDPVYVITLWENLDAVMTLKLNNDTSLSSRQQDKLTLMDQCGHSTIVKAAMSDLLMTNGPAHILSRPCIYTR